jgi:hypothetical protein
VIVNLSQCEPRKTAGLGATLGEQHMASIQKAVAAGTISPGELVILDYEGIRSVNGSYIKATAFWLFICGRLVTINSGSDLSPRHPADPRPYDLFIAVTGLNPDIRDEFQEFLQPRRFPMLLVTRMNETAVEEAVLLGHLDPILLRTLKLLTHEGRATAPALYEAEQDNTITVTAWNNRLNDLHSLRLVRRFRAGRAWEYEPLAKKLIWE